MTVKELLAACSAEADGTAIRIARSLGIASRATSFAFLTDPDNRYEPKPPSVGSCSTGRRLAFAHWLTKPGSRPAALLARVLANRIWQHHFGIGLAATSDNLGYTGSRPTHSELLEFLAGELAYDQLQFAAAEALAADERPQYGQAKQGFGINVVHGISVQMEGDSMKGEIEGQREEQSVWVPITGRMNPSRTTLPPSHHGTSRPSRSSQAIARARVQSLL